MKKLAISMAVLFAAVLAKADEVLFADTAEIAAFDSLLKDQKGPELRKLAENEKAKKEKKEEEKETSSEPTGPVKLARTPSQYQ